MAITAIPKPPASTTLTSRHTDDDWMQATAASPPGQGSHFAPSGEASSWRTTTGRSKVSLKDVADMTAQMAIMLQSGVDVSTALESLSHQCRRPALASVLAEVHQSVVSGSSFSEALVPHDHIFGGTYVATVAAGEASGKMAAVLHQLAQLQRSELRLRRTLRSMLIYPTLLAGVSTVVLGVLVLFVLPQFADLFQQYDTPLPVPTKILLALSGEFRTRWWLWAPLGVAAVLGAISLVTTRSGRRVFDRWLVHMVPVREASRTLITGRICRLIGLLMESGVPLLDSLRSTRHATQNYIYRDLLTEMEDAVVNGQRLATVLETATVFPPAAIEMLATAEKTGRIGEVARLIGVYFEEEGEAKARQMVSMLEPLITVVMGAIVAAVVLSVMLPVFTLSTLAQH